jgi:hypothetical protein
VARRFVARWIYADRCRQSNFFESFELFARRKRPDLDQNADWVKTDSGTAIVARQATFGVRPGANATVPEPATLWLLLAGILTLYAVADDQRCRKLDRRETCRKRTGFGTTRRLSLAPYLGSAQAGLTEEP